MSISTSLWNEARPLAPCQPARGLQGARALAASPNQVLVLITTVPVLPSRVAGAAYGPVLGCEPLTNNIAAVELI